VHDLLERLQRALAVLRPHQAQRAERARAVRDDVGRRAALDPADRADRAEDRVDPPRRELLQAHDQLRQRQDRVAQQLRVAGVATLALHRHLELVGRRVHRAGHRRHHAVREPRLDVRADHGVHPGLGQHTGLDDVERAGRRRLLARLQQREDRPRDADAHRRAADRDQGGEVDVVAARVHQLVARRPRHAGALQHGQRVELRPQRHDRAVPARQRDRAAGLGDAGALARAERAGHQPGGVLFVAGAARVLVHGVPEFDRGRQLLFDGQRPAVPKVVHPCSKR
jgi:hypothetical protein